MANVLGEYLDGDLNEREFQQYLKSGAILKLHENPHPANETPNTDFVSYFLNFIREESSHHFTSDLPVISPKKIKKKKKTVCPRTPNTSNESAKSSARGSLFSTPPSGNRGGSTISPVLGVTTQNDVSPISPAVKHGQSSSESLKVAFHVTSTPVKFNLDEDFPPVSSQKESKRKNATTPTRRITPTPARASYPRRGSSTVFKNLTFETSQESDTSFGSDPSLSSEKSFKQRQKFGNIKSNHGSASPKNSRRNTSKLKLEDFMQKDSCKRGNSSSRQQNSFNQTNTSFDKNGSLEYSQHNYQNRSKDVEMFENDSTSVPSVVPKKEQVTQESVLRCLANAHSFCIRENLVPNIVVELCFILQLLTLQGIENKENGVNSRYLTTIHNCVYYGILVLEKLTRIFKLLDKGTLRLLLDNPRISEFSSTLQAELNKAYLTIPLNKVPYSLVKSPLNSVPFQANVDNRNNFSNDQAFHCFKKQRDTFYEIVREWEECHAKPGWCIEEKLGNKIRFVVHQRPGLSNHSHFARLFQSQLIQMCCYENSLPTFNEGESPEIVGNLLKSNPEKFFRLQQRLVAPLSATSGPCPSPGFTETEEFFREFIMCAMCPSFNRYLMDSFISKIIELNSLDVTESLANSIREHPEEETEKFQVQFATCVLTLRTLAKFLGFLVFSPYHSSTEIPIAVKENLLNSRNQVSEPLDVMQYLEKAQKEQKLVLTLPWVIEYLSTIDSVGPFLDYYKNIFDSLHHIYKVILLQESSFNTNRNSLMLAVGLGWLFEIPTIPETAFSKSPVKTTTECERQDFLTLDGMDLVDQQLLYTCCPYLGELRSILAEAVIGKTPKRGSVKKIKPICADKTEVSSSPYRRLQTQLEDNFFRNQPEFLKKIVDFVISRIYYNLIVFVKNSIIPLEIAKAKKNLNIESIFNQGHSQEFTKDELKEKNKGLILRLSNKVTDESLQRISDEVDRECKTRSLDSLRSLSPFDMDDVVIQTAAGVAHQSTMDKLLDWSHQTLPGLIEKDIEQDIDKIISRHYNNSLNNHRKHAENPDNSLNWFYQQLVEKAECKQSVSQPDITTNSTQHTGEHSQEIEENGFCLQSENRDFLNKTNTKSDTLLNKNAGPK